MPPFSKPKVGAAVEQPTPAPPIKPAVSHKQIVRGPSADDAVTKKLERRSPVQAGLRRVMARSLPG